MNDGALDWLLVLLPLAAAMPQLAGLPVATAPIAAGSLAPPATAVAATAKKEPPNNPERAAERRRGRARYCLHDPDRDPARLWPARVLRARA